MCLQSDARIDINPLFGMRTAVNGIALPVIHRTHRECLVAAVRTHDFNHIADAELVFLQESRQPLFVKAVDNAEKSIAGIIGIAVVDLFLLRRLSVVKAGRKRTIDAFGDFLSVTVNIPFIKSRILQTLVDSLALRPHRHRHIIRIFHPPLDLEAVDAGIDQIRDMLNHAQIL